MIPWPDPLVIAWLRDHPDLAPLHGGRVSTRLDDVLPALRVTLVYDAQAATAWERVPVYQIEVWAEDEVAAGQIATDVANTWASFKGRFGAAYISGSEVVTWPRPEPDPETDLPRYLLEAAAYVHPAKE